MGRLELIRQDDDVTVLKGLAVAFGSENRRDLSGEYFDADTWFGDEYGIDKKFAIYDHAVNDMQNPYSEEGAPPDPIIGVAKYIETDARGRWFEFEIKRANEYHDYIMALHAMNRLGTSSRTLPGKGVKVMDPKIKGRIAKWPEVEVTLTPTPCDDATAFTEEDVTAVIGAMKAHAPHLHELLVQQAMKQAADEAAAKALAESQQAANEAGEVENQESGEQPDTPAVDPLEDAIGKLKAPVEEEETEPQTPAPNAEVEALQQKITELESQLAELRTASEGVKTLVTAVETIKSHLTTAVAETTSLKAEMAGLKKAKLTDLLKGKSAQELAVLGIPPQPKGYTPAPVPADGFKPVVKTAFADNPDAPGS